MKTMADLIGEWIFSIWGEIKKDPVRKILLILISPILIKAMADVILEFDWLSTVGYYFACVYGFSKILQDPYRIIKWGVGYVIGATALKMIPEILIPAYDSNNLVSIFSVVVIG